MSDRFVFCTVIVGAVLLGACAEDGAKRAGDSASSGPPATEYKAATIPPPALPPLPEPVVAAPAFAPPPPPPPPPPAPVIFAAADFAAADKASSVSSAPTKDHTQPEPQAGLLTAGDYDDVLNPQLYKSYLDKALQKNRDHKKLPYVDAADRIAVRVIDDGGKPVPFADIDLTTPQGGKMFSLRTGANGTVYLYPNFDALQDGTMISVRTDQTQTTIKRTLTAAMLQEGGDIAVSLDHDAPSVEKLDIVLVLDATGSMSDEMRFLQTELTSIMRALEQDNDGLDIRAGLVVYRDKGDEYITREFDLTGNLDAFNKNLSEQSARGGGDFPEAVHIAMQKSGTLDWRADAVKVNLLVGDAPPHNRDISATWRTALDARIRGTHIVPIAASGVDPTAEFLMRAMAQLTGGRYLFLTDDSGVGNPHAEPDVDCYVVTPLNGLVQRVLESLVRGTRVEPTSDNIIRTVGNYREGKCA